ncbi:MAG: SbcC/MukB-like Walker B domain-containing protein [Planctomycetota bacterium]
MQDLFAHPADTMAGERPSRPDFRLARFEVLNWGTFNARVWTTLPNGENALLTGDIGSGKSTLVDALTTLLVPPRKITYNKAAGAEGRERSLHSYVRGEYRTVSNETTGGAQAQALRGENTYSVLLAAFADSAQRRTVTVAQVFWLKEGERSPGRLYVVAEADLQIALHFTNFGSDVQGLRKRLRGQAGVMLFDSFEEYGERMRRELGIPHAQALDLFYQTVSMKSVGNLTDFVRRHMLEPDDTGDRIRALIGNFENLNQAHEAVVRARDQIGRLAPLVADGAEMEALAEQVGLLRRSREGLSACFASHRARLLGERIETLDFDARKLEQKLAQIAVRLGTLSRERSDVRAAVELQGGGRIREIEAEIGRRHAERAQQQTDEQHYRKLCEALGIRPGTTLDAFMAATRDAAKRRAEIDAQKQALDLRAIEKAVEFRETGLRDKALSDEIQSLKGRESNIPVNNIRIRDALAEALDVDAGELPFAGELLRVRTQDAAWEGAIERVLHGFGLSLLVPEALYARVSHYVDRTHLQGRLVYLRVREDGARQPARSTGPRSVARKLEIKPDSAHYSFLERELAEQFDYACCEDLDEFRRLPRAITLSGLLKTHERRHEKDDRFRIDDRSRFVLGWDNRAKLKTLLAEQKDVRARLLAINAGREALKKQADVCEQQLRAAERLVELDDYARIDWRSTAAAIQRLEDEKRELESSNDQLRTLRERLTQLDEEYATTDRSKAEADQELGGVRMRLEESRQNLGAANDEVAAIPAAERAATFPLIEEWRERTLAGQKSELRLLEGQQRQVREAIQSKIDADDKQGVRLREKIVEQMQRYKAAYPAESAEMDARTEALPEYRRRLSTLQDDDLPRFEARFKNLLNKETINSMAALQAHLQRRRHDIEEKTRTINVSLGAIEYDRTLGTFIELASLPAADAEVRDFQSELRACISGSAEDGELYTEQKFLQVKQLVGRMMGREGQSDQDARWTLKVTDVRNWFEFGAVERWRADGTEREFYRDSSGKSGGQKEKLAYTILAAALAYQFGLDQPASKKRRFRFVVIDEAFGRGSDDSTRYGLELFAKLDLQLLIVTPLQKIAVIEDYIAAVHFVHNEGGANSMVQNLTIEAYRARRQEFVLAAAAANVAATATATAPATKTTPAIAPASAAAGAPASAAAE